MQTIAKRYVKVVLYSCRRSSNNCFRNCTWFNFLFRTRGQKCDATPLCMGFAWWATLRHVWYHCVGWTMGETVSYRPFVLCFWILEGGGVPDALATYVFRIGLVVEVGSAYWKRSPNNASSFWNVIQWWLSMVRTRWTLLGTSRDRVEIRFGRIDEHRGKLRQEG